MRNGRSPGRNRLSPCLLKENGLISTGGALRPISSVSANCASSPSREFNYDAPYQGILYSDSETISFRRIGFYAYRTHRVKGNREDALKIHRTTFGGAEIDIRSTVRNSLKKAYCAYVGGLTALTSVAHPF